MGMFDGGVGMFGGGFVGANTGGGFVGARPGGGMSAQSYLQWEAARQAQQREDAMKRQLMRQDQQNTDREMTLKERLAQSQMDDSAASQALARDRLGLDANTASNDANQRANALSLQERLGWAGENRMANSDQMQAERANQQLSLQERLGLMSEGRLARGQDQDEAFRRAQLGQQAQLAQMPYQQQTADSRAQGNFQNRQLGQQDKQFNRQYTDMPLADRFRNQLAEKQQILDQSNTDRAFNDLSARDRQTGSLEEKRMGMTERLAGNENQLRRDLQGETLKQQLQMWSGLSAAEKQQNAQFGQKLAQDLFEFKNVSGNNQFTIDAQRGMHDETILAGDRRAGLDWQNSMEDRALRERMGNQSNATANRNMLLDFVSRLQNIDPQVHENIMGSVAKEFGGNAPQFDPAERATMNMARESVRQAQGGNAATNPMEQSQQNVLGGETLGQQVLRGHLTVGQAEKIASEGDKNTVRGATTMRESLMETLRKAAASQRAYDEKTMSPASSYGFGSW